MEMRNLVKEKIAANGYALGAFVASSSPMMIAARFIAGLPHGAYFGVAAIIADKLVEKYK